MNKAIAAILLISLQLMCERSYSSTPAARTESENELSGLLQARSLEELAASSKKAAAIILRSDECKAELALKVIPRSCFAPTTSKSLEKWLTKECVARALASKSRQDLDQSNAELPEKCRQAAAERLADLDYLDQNERPSEIWTTWTRN